MTHFAFYQEHLDLKFIKRCDHRRSVLCHKDSHKGCDTKVRNASGEHAIAQHFRHFSVLNKREKKVRKETTTAKINECIKQAAIFRSEDPAAAAQHPERGGGVGKQQRKVGSRVLPYNRRVALSDSDVVGGPLHIHTPDGESCGDKTKQSEKRSL